MKYFKIETSKGREVYRFNPKPNVRTALGVSGTTFTSKTEAKEYSKRIELAYEDYLRRKSGNLEVGTDTVDGLIHYFFTTSEFKDLKPNTLEYYKKTLRTAQGTGLVGSQGSKKPFGSMLHRNITTVHADKLKQTIETEVSAHRSVHCMKILRRIWYVGMRHDKVSGKNPFAKMGLKALTPRTRRWSTEQIDTFIAKADELGYHGLGTMALMQYHLCQRPGDIRNMTWDNIEGDTIRFTQEKTQVQVTAPLTERLKERLKEIPRSEHTNNIVYHSSRRPDALGKVSVGVNYNRRLYPKHATIVKRAAGIDKTLWMSDLRRTGATEMANAGCTDDEMRSVTGHKTRDILSIYLVLDKTTSTNAMNKRFG